jgi:hypothetical protein
MRWLPVANTGKFVLVKASLKVKPLFLDMIIILICKNQEKKYTQFLHSTLRDLVG